jgi:hypothetical protein
MRPATKVYSGGKRKIFIFMKGSFSKIVAFKRTIRNFKYGSGSY